MNTDEILIKLFQSAEEAKTPVRVSFRDGSRYDLRILSTGHAEEGGDIVADVLRSIQSPRPDVWKTSAMNFKLETVVRVEAEDKCLFTR